MRTNLLMKFYRTYIEKPVFSWFFSKPSNIEKQYLERLRPAFLKAEQDLIAKIDGRIGLLTQDQFSCTKEEIKQLQQQINALQQKLAQSELLRGEQHE